MTKDKLNKLILVLYNLCGMSLVVLAGAGMAPPVGYVPPMIWGFCSLPFMALIGAHIARWIVKRKSAISVKKE